MHEARQNKKTENAVNKLIVMDRGRAHTQPCMLCVHLPIKSTVAQTFFFALRAFYCKKKEKEKKSMGSTDKGVYKIPSCSLVLPTTTSTTRRLCQSVSGLSCRLMQIGGLLQAHLIHTNLATDRQLTAIALVWSTSQLKKGHFPTRREDILEYLI